MDKRTLSSHLKKINNTECSFVSLFLDSGVNFEFETEKNLLIFLLDGNVKYSIDYHNEIKVSAPCLYLVPKVKHYVHETVSDAELFILPFSSYLEILNVSYETESELSKTDIIRKEDSSTLKMTDMLLRYFTSLRASFSYGLKSTEFINLKIRELMIILEKEYKSEERITFFYPLIDREPAFSDFVYENYRKARSVKRLADLSCYSQSGFEKKFRKIFGLAPSKWIKQRLSIDVYNDLIKSSKPFNEISTDYGFSSPSHFNSFCKTILGGTPGELRKKYITPERF